MFLNANGFRLVADPLDAGNTFFGAAAGQLDEEALVAWISAHSVIS
jgi:prophage maintenance system killer protein